MFIYIIKISSELRYLFDKDHYKHFSEIRDDRNNVSYVMPLVRFGFII